MGRGVKRWVILGSVLGGLGFLAWFVSWLLCAHNPLVPAGYVGYLTKGSWLGEAKFYGTLVGPASPGKTWFLSTTNVSVTPYTYSEDFTGDESVLSKDNLKVEFRVHIVWKVNPERVKDFIEKYTTISPDDQSDQVVKTAYNNFLREPLRTYARDAIQGYNGLEIKEKITPIGNAVFDRVKKLADGTPFDISSVVVGNIQYPKAVADRVAEKLATTQLLEQKETEIAIEKQEREKRIVQAEGIARAMEIIQSKLTPQYLQHEAIEAQKSMVGSPNHTTVYIPVGPMGVPMVGTFDVSPGKESHPSPQPPK